MKRSILILVCIIVNASSFCQDALDPDDPGIEVFKAGNKYGYRDANGKVLIQPAYDMASPFQYGLAGVTLGKREALIGRAGNIVIPFGTYDIIYSFREGMARVAKANRYGFIDKTWKEIIPCIYDEADFFREGISPVRKGGRAGIIDRSGKEVVPLVYDELIVMQSTPLVKIRLNGKWGYIDREGKPFIPAEYDELDQPWHGMIMAKKDGKYGYFNYRGELAIPLKYDQANPFTETGRALIMLNGKKGVVMTDGTEKFLK